MKKELERIVLNQWRCLGINVAVLLTIVAVFESDIIEQGTLIGMANAEYLLETALILATLLLIPYSLKLIHRNKAKLRALSDAEALHTYYIYALVRVSILALLMDLGLVIYYMTLNTIGAFCTLIAAVAVLFCLPSKKELINDLDIHDCDE